MQIAFNKSMKRRAWMGGAIALTAALGACQNQASPPTKESTEPPSQAVPPAAEPTALRPAVDSSLQYFQKLAVEHKERCQGLLAAIRKNDLAAAKEAYIAARPSYEQIEILAASFEQTDRDIDARPAVFALGETDPEFRGAHRIEALLFRDGALTEAVPYAETLVQSAQTLIADLNQREAFSAKGHWQGAIALANEVGAKKITSEEETWSDASLLIFRENWRGIGAIWQAFRELVTDEKVKQEVDAAYQNALQTVAGFFRGEDSTQFTPYSQVSLADRQKIVRATNRLRDSLQGAARSLDLALS